jgi:FKBP-type peptidyl-prolyl cis-trans isomerase FkpA
MKVLSFPLVIAMILMGSCFKEPTLPCTKAVPTSLWTGLNQTQLQNDIQAIDDYLVANAITATEHESGLRYVVHQTGTGEGPCLERLIAATYQGRLMDTGTVFDSSAEPLGLYLNGLIAGWQIAFLNFNKGTKATLYIPSGLGYGAAGAGNGTIPPNANLIFVVELVDFE